MANSLTTQILNDGYRNVTLKVTGILDTSDVSATDIIDPATLGPIDQLGTKASKLRVDSINYSIEDTLTVRLWWDATSDVLMVPLAGRGCIKSKKYGGLQNNAGSGRTGKVQLSTEGWSASAILTFDLVIEFVKQV